MFTTYYGEYTRKVVVGFGTLFNNIYVNHPDDGVGKKIRVPLTYAPKEKFVRRLLEESSISTDTKVGIRLPQLSFAMSQMAVDPSRRRNKVNTDIYDVSGSTGKKMIVETPINYSFNLFIYTRHITDTLQIAEQIIPYFAPEYTVTVKMNDLHEEVDIPIVLNGVTVNEDYEGPLDTRRTLIGVLDFTAKTYVYPQICGITANNGMGILISDVNFYEGRTGVANIAGSNYVSDVGYTGNAITGSITKVTGD